jgi:hypothetical protein
MSYTPQDREYFFAIKQEVLNLHTHYNKTDAYTYRWNLKDSEYIMKAGMIYDLLHSLVSAVNSVEPGKPFSKRNRLDLLPSKNKHFMSELGKIEGMIRNLKEEYRRLVFHAHLTIGL